MHAECDVCFSVYESDEPSDNFIVFCPKCKKRIFSSSMQGKGPVIPCDIYLGNKKTGLITIKGMSYRLIAHEPPVDVVLSEPTTDLRIYDEASRIYSDRLIFDSNS